jgi:hypothetical protein
VEPGPRGRRVALELGVVSLLLVAVTGQWALIPSWLAELGRFQAWALAGFALCAFCLWRAPRYATLPGAGVVIAVVALVLRLQLWPVTPTLSDDVYRYLWEGRVAAAGLDPYALAPSSPQLAHLRDSLYARINHPELSTIYPPVAIAGFALVAGVWPALAGMKLWVILWDMGVVLALLAWARREGRNPVWVAAYAWNPLVLTEFAGSGHNDPCAMLGLVLALGWGERRPVASAAALVLGALTKLVPLLALPFLFRRWNASARVLAVVGLVAGLGGFIAATRGPDSGLTAYSLHWRNNDLLFTVLVGGLGDPRVARLAALALVAAAAAVLWARGAGPANASRWLTRVALLVSPTVHPWYLGWPLLHEPLGPSWPWLLFSLTALLSYGVLQAPAEGTSGHLPLAWRALEYGLPLALAAGLWAARRSRQPRTHVPAAAR